MAKLVNAETVAAMLPAELAVVDELDAAVDEVVAPEAAAVLVALAALVAVKALYREAVLVLPTLLIDIIHSRSEPVNMSYRHPWGNL